METCAARSIVCSARRIATPPWRKRAASVNAQTRGITWAVIVFFVMVFVDVTAGYFLGGAGKVTFVIEESSKGLGGCLFLGTFTACRFQLRNAPSPSTSEPAAGCPVITHAANLSTGPPAHAGEPSKVDSPVG